MTKFILEKSAAVRFSKAEFEELESLAVTEGCFWGSKPNVSAVIRKLLDDHTRRENLLPLFRLLKMSRETNDPDLVFAVVDAIGKHFSSAAADEVFAEISKEATTNYDKLSRGPAIAKTESGATPPITNFPENPDYQRRYKTWYDALSGFPEPERRRLAAENAHFT